MDGVQADAVVAPAALAGERLQRHELDDVDAEVDEVVEVIDGGRQRAFLGERADVDLVEDAAEHVAAAPGGVRPHEAGRVVDLRGAVHAVGLAAAARIGVRLAAVDAQ